MKRIVILSFLISFCFLNISFANNCSNYKSCESYCDNKEKYYDLWYSSSYNDVNRNYYYDTYKDNYNKYYECESEESEKFNSFFDKGYSSYEYGDYKASVDNYIKAIRIKPDSEAAIGNIALAYYELADGSFDKGNYNDAIGYYKLSEDYGYGDKYLIYFNTGVSYYILGDVKKSLEYYNRALDITFDNERIKSVKDRIELVESLEDQNRRTEEAKKNAPSNDTYSYAQYYINDLNILKTKNSININKKVIVAIIDDGININHPDLTKNIWTNKNEIPGNKIDDDNNGYVDDFNGWNFVYNSNNLIPLGSHGTSVAGIIGAESNNKEGVMGIINNVKMMPVGVCDIDGCLVDNVTKGIKYAVDNGADIINLSLGGHQFSGYNNSYDEALKYAYSKGVIVVIASGNGDILSEEKEGVNTSVNKVSPICNYGNSYKNIIGVGSFNQDGYRSRWSNYGECVSFYSPGVNIFSTSILEEDQDIRNYAYKNGTSFSAPIVTGIIGLGYNKHGKIDNKVIWDALNYSLVENEVGNKQIDAYKYLIYLDEYISKKELNDKANNILYTFDKVLKKYPEFKRKEMYKKYADLLNSYIPKLKEGTKKDLISIVAEGLNNRSLGSNNN